MTRPDMDPYVVFRMLGPVATYRRPDVLETEWDRVERAAAELRHRFDDAASDRERLTLAIDVIETFVHVARPRACDCQVLHEDVACENLDVLAVLDGLVEHMRRRLGPAVDGEASC